jgi:hypothetical protein
MKAERKNNQIVRYLFLLLLSLNVNNVVSQENFNIDTLLFGESYKILINIPDSYRKNVTNYEEGTFISYFNVSDFSTITVHFGSMVSLPLINDSSCIVSDTFISSNKGQLEIRKIKGYCITKFIQNQNLFFREDDYLMYNLSFVYENISFENIDKFEKIFDNIKIIW